jgi:cellulose synthase/poly-beta-1,6-N-acetylglucosamine synthase-like glycosyltransferase
VIPSTMWILAAHPVLAAAPVLAAPVAWVVLAATALTLGLLLPFAFHRLHLLRVALRERAGRMPGPRGEGAKDLPRPRGEGPGSGTPHSLEWEGALPRVTIQLPLFNEATVVERLLDAAAALDYPRNRLQIQILDDSTDETVGRAQARAEAWQARGVRMEHLRRGTREGFKAGALQWGMARAEGEFFLILDADFVPEPDLIRRLLPSFRDPGVGMVQARWDHLNEEARLLTRCQALLLDAHFFFEQGGRYATGCFLNFNGTAGMWRRSALEEAGGWSSDTLTEDLDVSYRAQMAGWRFVFLPGVGVAAELPENPRSLEVQQKRWAQGGIQTGRKLLRPLWQGPWPVRVKVEGTIHFLGHLGHPLTLVLGVLLLPSAVARDSLGLRGLLHLDLAIFILATLSFLTFYVAAGRMRRRPWIRLIPTAVATLSLGIGLTAPVSRSVLRGLRRRVSDPFLRTPKQGRDRIPFYAAASFRGDTVLRLGLLVWTALSILLAIHWGYLGSLPFLVLFGAGWGWMSLGARSGAGRGSAERAGAPLPTGTVAAGVGTPGS